MAKTRLVYKDAKSHKFWEIEVDGTETVVTFGRVGTAGQTKRKAFGSAAEAEQSAEKQTRAKEKKGYARDGGGGGKSIASRVSDVKAWLKKHHPEELELFKPPATAKAIAAAEKALGRSLPDDYKEFLAIHNGQDSVAAMVEGATLLQVEDLAERYNDLLSLDDGDQEVGEDEVDPEVEPVYFSEGWVPIGCSARGRDFLCIDFSPTKKGREGQIILFVIDADDRSLVANSFAELLDEYLVQADEGEIYFVDD